MDRERFQDYTGNGERAMPTFSASEMQRRVDSVRRHMAGAGVDAALFTSYHNINYYSDFLYCQFGRRYGLVIDHDDVTSISAGIDGGQPWRRTFGGRNVTYTDWQKDNWFHAVRKLTAGAGRIGIEFDHVNVDLLTLLRAEFPQVEFVDIAQPAMRLRMVKSAEEIAHIEKMTRIADLGGAACVEATAVGVPEHEVALHSTATMVREIAKVWPHAELLDTWTWFQSGINTDGAHNPVTSRRIERGTSCRSTAFRWWRATTSRSSGRSSPRPRATSTSGSGRSTAASTTGARSSSCPGTGARTSRRN
jgi:creatinase